MDRLHLKYLGDTSVVSECSLGVKLVSDHFLQFQILHICIKFESNRTITYGDIAFWRVGGYKSRSVLSECSLGVNLVMDNVFLM